MPIFVRLLPRFITSSLSLIILLLSAIVLIEGLELFSLFLVVIFDLSALDFLCMLSHKGISQLESRIAR